MNPAELESVWKQLQSPVARGDLVGQPVDGGLGVSATLAVDAEERRHLLIPAPADAEDQAQPSIRGIGLSVDDLRVDDLPVRRYYDISCRDMTMHENFSAVVAEILDALPSSEADIGSTLDSIFNRWRWFWRVAPDSMNMDVAIGLFGELWFIEHWLPPVEAAVLTAWTGPQGDRHDFKWPQASVEVKATRVSSDGSAKHRISRLDQLENPEKGTLYLFSLRVAVDEIGGNSLNQSVRRLRDQLAKTPDLLANFEEAIGLLGYNPAHARHYDVPLRVVGEELYRVEEGFPRLTGDTVGAIPAGVDEISYSLNLAACRDWLIATKPGRESQELRASLKP
jgi:Putative  PD-(D/E)XK family member, (DUF4420)